MGVYRARRAIPNRAAARVFRHPARSGGRERRRAGDVPEGVSGDGFLPWGRRRKGVADAHRDQYLPRHTPLDMVPPHRSPRDAGGFATGKQRARRGKR